MKFFAQFRAAEGYEPKFAAVLATSDDGAVVAAKAEKIKLGNMAGYLPDGIDVTTKEGKEIIKETKQRIGQDQFRKWILGIYGGKCCVTGLDVPEVLRASHIVAWADDVKNRMNPSNGLCLSATYDAVFDRHLITFDDEYRMVLSKSLKDCCTAKVHRDYFSTFRLIMRQRQMASCIPAALRAWRGLGVVDDYDEEVNVDTERIQRMTEMPQFDEFDLERLEADDSKFNRILEEVERILAANPQEKIVVFSFFRTTVRYLVGRLEEAGISVIGLMGGLDRKDKSERLAQFKDSDINVLVSTEVGSEGIDLQFARYELNYDLPWNPMRLEQRIGRIDRIGQRHNPIFICNAYCENTIEDRILQRLYERIAIFQNVIGDLEEILGEKTDQMACEVFRSGELTEDEIAARADQVVDAMCHQQELAKSLELEAGMMSSDYQNFVLQNICKAREANRLLTPAELMFFC